MTGAILVGTVTVWSPMKWVYLVGAATSSLVESALILCVGRNLDRDCRLQHRRANIIVVAIQSSASMWRLCSNNWIARTTLFHGSIIPEPSMPSMQQQEGFFFMLHHYIFLKKKFERTDERKEKKQKEKKCHFFVVAKFSTGHATHPVRSGTFWFLCDSFHFFYPPYTTQYSVLVLLLVQPSSSSFVSSIESFPWACKQGSCFTPYSSHLLFSAPAVTRTMCSMRQGHIVALVPRFAVPPISCVPTPWFSLWIVPLWLRIIVVQAPLWVTRISGALSVVVMWTAENTTTTANPVHSPVAMPQALV